jgi:ABC-type branched-subunit amino acid transport system ATPase component
LAADGTTLAVQDVCSGYGGMQILRGVTLDLPPRSITAIIGANGAGKSTLLKTIFGIVPTTSGRLLFEGNDITTLSAQRRLRLGLGLVPQGRSNFPLMTVEENLEMGAYVRTDRAIRADIERIYEAYPMLDRKRGEPAGNLSGGEQQVLEIAMALMLSPRLALIDEPSLGLSPAMQKVVFDAISQLRDVGTAVLMVEQNAVQALGIADRGVVLELGRISAVGTGPEMLQNPEIRRAYLGLPDV